MPSLPENRTMLQKFTDFNEISDLMLDALCLVDRDGRFVSVNAAFTRIFGYEAEEVIGKPMVNLIFAPDRERTIRKVGDILDGELTTLFENRWTCKDGRVVTIMWSARWSEQYQVRVAIGRDMTEYKRGQYEQVAIYAISEAAYSSANLTELLQRVHHFVGEWLPSTNFLVALHDNGKDEISFPYAAVLFDHDLEACRTAAGPLIGSVMAGGQTATSEALVNCYSLAGASPLNLHSLGIPLRIDNESVGALVIQKNALDAEYTNKQKELLQFVALQIAGFIQRKHMEKQLQFMAGHDALTKLPNRALFLDRFKVALSLAQRDKHPLALLFVDLNGFKAINDRHGHLCGDAILQESARRLEGCVRASDTVTRFGGDEFVVLLHAGNLKAEGVHSIVEKIAQAIQKPMVFGDATISISASVGISRYPDDGSTLDELINHADKAMYAIKRKS